MERRARPRYQLSTIRVPRRGVHRRPPKPNLAPENILVLRTEPQEFSGGDHVFEHDTWRFHYNHLARGLVNHSLDATMNHCRPIAKSYHFTVEPQAAVTVVDQRGRDFFLSAHRGGFIERKVQRLSWRWSANRGGRHKRIARTAAQVLHDIEESREHCQQEAAQRHIAAHK